jgi:hypothetical protein
MNKCTAVSQDRSAATEWEKWTCMKLKTHDEIINMRQGNTKDTIYLLPNLLKLLPPFHIFVLLLF